MSTLARIKEIENIVSSGELLLPEWMPKGGVEFIEQADERTKLLLRAFNVMRDIAVEALDRGCVGHESEEEAEQCNCSPKNPAKLISERFENRMLDATDNSTAP